jgi:hypothetical protein
VRTRSVVAALATFVGGVGIALLACGFPKPDIEGDNTTDGSSQPETGSSNGDGSSSGKPDTGPCDDANCDCDRDGFLKKDCHDGAAELGPTDCDDTDPRAKPDADFREDPPEPTTKGDWNCDGKPEVEVTSSGVNCGASLAASSGCSSISGYVEKDVACGAKRQFKKCKAPQVGTFCEDDTVEERRQRCR